MRIISKFNDFYDNIGIYSDNPLWIRKESCFIIDLTKKTELSLDQMRFIKRLMDSLPKPVIVSGDRYYYDNHDCYFVLLICGKLYHFLVTANNTPMVNIDDYVKHMNAKYNIMIRKVGLFGNFDERNLQAWYQEFGNEDKLIQIHLSLKSPIIKLNHTRFKHIELTCNPNLKNLHINKLMNGWELYQDIEMFLSNQMSENKEIVPDFGDEIKRDYHGMDEWSFKRKTNTKKRKKKSGKIKRR